MTTPVTKNNRRKVLKKGIEKKWDIHNNERDIVHGESRQGGQKV